MSRLTPIYRTSLGLLTDLYELTMACGYWKTGLALREAVFQLVFRQNPFGGGYAVSCGLAAAVDYLKSWSFAPADLAFLAGQRGNDGMPLFASEFLRHLGEQRFRCDVDAMVEGTVVLAGEPMLRVRGPLLQCQLVETALLTMMNFETLVATKAARIKSAAGDDPVLEFGLRRAQGIDGGLSASRAAFVGGCSGTSNVLAGRLFGIPVGGTHAHSWIMAFDDELDAMCAYADAMPNNCIFLVDTYDSIQGVHHAVEAGRRLRRCGHEMIGIRLDSGDLAALSVEARRILDEGGFPDARIVASNDLDERSIARLKARGAPIAVWGVGTRLATAYDEPALGGVYKLTSIRDEDGRWLDRLKLSDDPLKTTTPGILQVRRFELDGRAIGDCLLDERSGRTLVPVDPADGSRRTIPSQAAHEDLLVPVFRSGTAVCDLPDAAAAQERCRRQLHLLPDAVRHVSRPAAYPVWLDEGVYRKKNQLIEAARRKKP
ncbi:MAG: nicotinate phosphoribosyltransferase [Thermoguttaceae bacterium]